MYINGEWVTAQSGKMFDVFNPANGDRIGQVRRPIAEDKSIHLATRMIEDAKRPLLLIGAGSNRKMTSRMLTEW